ncbi:MAG: ribosomal protein S18-alanine N-acetyltransferase [Haloferacaceae archaeon]
MSSPLTDEVSIRRAEQADLLEVLRIERASFPQPWPFSAFEEHLGTPGFLVAERDAEVVGYVVAGTVPNYGRDLGHVKDFAVRPDARGEGVGSRLLRQALAALAIEGATDAKLEVREGNDGAMRLYRRFGFTPARRVSRYYADGEDALVMVLDLDAWLQGS